MPDLSTQAAVSLRAMLDALRDAEANFAGMRQSIETLVAFLSEANTQLALLGFDGNPAFRRHLRSARAGQLGAIMPAVRDVSGRLAQLLNVSVPPVGRA